MITAKKRIKVVREHVYMTQSDLGIALGYPPQSAAIRINQYERGTRNPKNTKCIAIADVLQCSPFEFTKGQDEFHELLASLKWLSEDELNQIEEELTKVKSDGNQYLK